MLNTHERSAGHVPALITALFLNPHIPPQCYNLSLNDYPNPTSPPCPLPSHENPVETSAFLGLEREAREGGTQDTYTPNMLYSNFLTCGTL